MPDNLTRDELLALFRADLHKSLTDSLNRDDVQGFAVYEDPNGKRRAVTTTEVSPAETDSKGGRLIGVLLKNRARRALQYIVDNPGVSVNAAAALHRISNQAVFDLIKRELKKQNKAARPVCPCCGQPIKTETDN